MEKSSFWSWLKKLPTKQQGVGPKYQGVFSTSTGSIALSRIKGSQSLMIGPQKLCGDASVYIGIFTLVNAFVHPFEADFLFRFEGSKPKRSLVLSWYIPIKHWRNYPPDAQDLAGHGTLWASPVLSSTVKSWLVPENPPKLSIVPTSRLFIPLVR